MDESKRDKTKVDPLTGGEEKEPAQPLQTVPEGQTPNATTAVIPGPVKTGFQEASGADYFADRLPGFTFKSAERVAEDGLRAAERGKRSIIPGGPLVRLAYGPNRFAPRFLQLLVARRLMKPPAAAG